MDAEEWEHNEREMFLVPMSDDPENPVELAELPGDDRAPDLPWSLAQFITHREEDKLRVHIEFDGTLDCWQTRDLALALIDGAKNLLHYGAAQLPMNRMK